MLFHPGPPRRYPSIRKPVCVHAPSGTNTPGVIKRIRFIYQATNNDMTKAEAKDPDPTPH